MTFSELRDRAEQRGATVKQLPHREFSLRMETRVRFGTLSEILEDIAHLEQFGHLPPKGKRTW